MAVPRSRSFAPPSPNERTILDIVRRRGAVSRAQISKISNLTGASVTRITQAMEERGLIEEMEPIRGARGQPARPLRLRPEAAFSIGLNFSHRTLDAVLVDFTGRMRALVALALEDASLETIVATAHAACRSLLERQRLRITELAGVGVSVPGYRSRQRDRFALHPTFSSLLARNLAEDFRGPLALPVVVERDAISAAIGESLVGHGRDRTSFGFVHLGHGIGGALIVNGHPVYGAHGNAGGIGDLFPRTRSRPSGNDLLAHLRDAGLPVADFADLATLEISACPPLAQWIERAALELGHGIAIFARMFDPHEIVVGGRLPGAICSALVDRIPGSPRPETYTDDLPQPVIKVSTHGPLSGAIGAACLPLYSQFFALASREA